MISRPALLALLGLPVAAIAYVLVLNVLSGLGLQGGLRDLVLLVVPLFVAGLVLAVFLVPFLDRKAKADLAAHRAQQGNEPADPGKD